MKTALLLLIYLAFISLGLPDSLMGTSWPTMYQTMGMQLSAVGIISFIIAVGTVISSLLSSRMIQRFGTKWVTAISVLMTAVPLVIIAYATQFYQLCLLAVPLGLGAGSVDAALNNYVALHYKAKHMNWLHCFWGVGASLGPMILSAYLAQEAGWRKGFFTIGLLQTAMAALLFLSLPLWSKAKKAEPQEEVPIKTLSIKQVLHVRGAKPALVAFFCYCALEGTTGLWGSSYMILHKGIDAQTAAQWISLFYVGITAGRALSGFVSMRLTNRQLTRLGLGVMLCGVLVVLLAPEVWVLPIGFCLVGLGCAPIYPAMLHETPNNFGSAVSQSFMGIQMACAYIGVTVMPPLFGLLAEHVSITLYPWYLLLIGVTMLLGHELLVRSLKNTAIDT